MVVPMTRDSPSRLRSDIGVKKNNSIRSYSTVELRNSKEYL